MGGSTHKKRKLPHVHTVLKTFFEGVIDEAYQLSATGTSIGLHGFGNDKPQAILSRIQLMYGCHSDSETECHLLRLHEPIDRTLPIEVMLHQIEEVQQFVTANLMAIKK
jgi:hypothetical protein